MLLKDYGSVGRHVGRLHMQRQVRHRTRTRHSLHRVCLLEESIVQSVVRRVEGGSEKNRRIVKPRKRHLGAAMGCEAHGRASAGSYHVYVGRTHTVACKRNPAAVGAPYRRGVICRIRAQLPGLATADGDCENIAPISKGYGGAVRRDGRVAKP